MHTWRSYRVVPVNGWLMVVTDGAACACMGWKKRDARALRHAPPSKAVSGPPKYNNVLMDVFVYCLLCMWKVHVGDILSVLMDVALLCGRYMYSCTM